MAVDYWIFLRSVNRSLDDFRFDGCRDVDGWDPFTVSVKCQMMASGFTQGKWGNWPQRRLAEQRESACAIGAAAQALALKAETRPKPAAKSARHDVSWG